MPISGVKDPESAMCGLEGDSKHSPYTERPKHILLTWSVVTCYPLCPARAQSLEPLSQ